MAAATMTHELGILLLLELVLAKDLEALVGGGTITAAPQVVKNL
jgi:hypothetical protein